MVCDIARKVQRRMISGLGVRDEEEDGGGGGEMGREMEELGLVRRFF